MLCRVCLVCHKFINLIIIIIFTMFGKLFDKKDDYGVLQFLGNAKQIQKDVDKFKSLKVEMKMEDVSKMITDVKNLYKEAKQVEINLTNADIDDKKRDVTLKLLVLKFDEIKELYDMVVKYEKQLYKYDNLGNDKK